jgi:hypothetical protein
MATTTPNFGWPVPTSTDLVKDGATAIESLGDSIDASLLDLKGGTSGQVLSKNSNTDMDFTWVTSDDANAIQNAIVDAKGDLIGATAADTPARLAVGTNGQVLTADSTEATGLKWATPTSSTGPAFRAFRSTSNQSIGSTTATKVQLNGETFDTDNCFDSTTNYRFTPTTAGYYLFTAMIGVISGGSGYAAAYIYKNGSRVAAARTPIYESNAKMPQISDIIYLNGSTDYIELYVLNNGATASVEGSTDESWLAGAFIHA